MAVDQARVAEIPTALLNKDKSRKSILLGNDASNHFTVTFSSEVNAK